MTNRVSSARRAGLAVGFALLSLAVLSAPASADGNSGRISEVSSAADGTVTLVFSAAGLADGDTLDPASVKATINGSDVKATATAVSDAAELDRTAILAIDTSGSMADDQKLKAAQEAADSYLTAVPADVKVGLITFADRAAVVVQPTTDRASVKTAVDALSAGGSTALYDAATLAAQTVGTTGSRSILLLSDGTDEGSKATEASAVTALDRSGATLDAVSLGTESQQVDTLTTLAEATGGAMVAISHVDDLTTTFENSARGLSNQLAVTLTVPAELASTGSSVTVSATAGGQTFTDTAFVPIAGAPQASVSASPIAAGPIPVAAPAFYDRISDTWLWVGLAAIFLGLCAMLAIGFIRASRRDPTSVRGRMSIYTLGGGRGLRKESETTSTALGDTQVARSAVELAGRAVRSRNMEELLERRIEAAGLPFKPGEWAVIHVGIAIGSALLLLLLTGGRILASLVGLALGVILPWVYLSIKESRRQAAFYAQLPDTLQLLSGSLSAGYSLAQAVDTVVREGTNPIAAEFNRALVEARLGVPIEDALDNVADRMNSKDFHWVVLAVRVQREVGGNLAELLNTVAATLRERERLRRQVQVLSAEGRLSAVIIALIPITFAVFLILVRPEYIQPLFTTLLGGLLLGFGIFMMIIGGLWLRRVVKVEV